MKLEFTHHARHRVFVERHISVAEIKTTINNPDGIRYEPGNLIKCKKLLDRGELVVIYSQHKSNLYMVITAYFKD